MDSPRCSYRTILTLRFCNRAVWYDCSAVFSIIRSCFTVARETVSAHLLLSRESLGYVRLLSR